MQYPINADKYIAAMRLLYGVDERLEGVCTNLIPIVNACYAAGLCGEGGFPMDADEEIRGFAELNDDPQSIAAAKRLMPPMVRWFNQAYEQGRKDAGERKKYGTVREDF